MDARLREAIEGIHASPTKAAIAATGGGGQALAWLLGVPNASNTVLEISVPYAGEALAEYLGHSPSPVVSEEVAMDMAQLAFERASQLSADPSATGIGATATIRTQREKKGEHRCFVASCSSGGRRGYGVTMVKGMRERQAEDEIVSKLIVRLLAEESGVGFNMPLGLSGQERLEVMEEPGSDPVRDLLEGSISYVVVDKDGSVSAASPSPKALLPGSFYPLHGGHEALARVASEILEMEVAFEISTANVDKPPLTYTDVSRRLRQFKGRARIVLTRAATFTEKARVLPGSTFVIGCDTAMRLFDPKYYGGSAAAMDEALQELRGSGCRFLVAGRIEDDRFRSLDDVGVPPGFEDMLTGIPESAFRRDVSSTEIRGAALRL
jgi:nicotinamide mononucleotide (NMN) deamidase PncC